VAVVNQTMPSRMTGEDHPLPGNGVFHRTFSVSLQRTGAGCSPTMPCPVGPRNSGQSAMQTNGSAKLSAKIALMRLL
jgi:hypothetical protein